MSLVSYNRFPISDQEIDEMSRFAIDNQLGCLRAICDNKSNGITEIDSIIAKLSKGDCIMVSKLAQLAGTLKQIYKIILECQNKGIEICSVKEKLVINADNNSPETKIVIQTIAMIIETESEIASMRTMHIQRKRAESGARVGRPEGIGTSKLEPHKEEIVSLLQNGSKKSWIAKHFNVTPATLYKWLVRNDIKTPNI